MKNHIYLEEKTINTEVIKKMKGVLILLMKTGKKSLFSLLVVSMVLLSACSNNATPTMNAEEYSTYQTLLKDNEFRISQTYHDIQILSYKFAKACLSDDFDTVNNLLVEGTKADVMLNIFGDLEFIITKNISAVPDKDGQYVVSCEYLPNGEDSYSYLTLQVIENGEALKVASYAFEK